MNSYRIFKVKKFPELSVNESVENENTLSLPGFTKPPSTKIKLISSNYHGYKYYEIEHEMLIKDNGIAFGFHNDEFISIPFSDYIKKFIITGFYNESERYLLLSERSLAIKNLFKTLKQNETLNTELEGYALDLKNLRSFVDDYLGAWFSQVSTRVSSSALFGSDLTHDPLFDQLLDDGANLTSVIIPYSLNGKTYSLQINTEAGISSHKKIDDRIEQLEIIKSVKGSIIDVIESMAIST